MRPTSSKLKLTAALLSLIVCPMIARAQSSQSDFVFGLLKGSSNGPWVAVSSKETVKPGEWVKITLTTRVPGYLYAVRVVRGRVDLLSSGKWDGQFVEAGKTVTFPELGFQLATDDNTVQPISVLLSGTRLTEQKVREILHLTPLVASSEKKTAKPTSRTAPPAARPEPVPTVVGDPIWDESKRVATVTVKPQQRQIPQAGNQASSLSIDSSSTKLGQREYLYVNLDPILKLLVSGGK